MLLADQWPLSALALALLLVLGAREPNERLAAAGDAFDWFRSLVGAAPVAPTSQPFEASPSASLSISAADQLQANNDLEREASAPFARHNQAHQQHRSPAQIVRSSFRNGRLASAYAQQSPLPPAPILERDLFKCVEPAASHYRQFARQYARKFDDDTDRLERLQLFALTMRRSIMLNRIIQNEITNSTNYQVKPEIGDYHFVEPVTPSGENVGAIWYADITDCELGLIKHIVFDIMFWIDKNEFALALKSAMENSEYLPLMQAEGFEQLANILLLRLYDRLRGDDKMNQLFRWPLYVKKLAAYAYSLRETMRPNFKQRLTLISFAYPAYFKDIKYNWPAINRTGDNVRANNEHKKFNNILSRNFANLRERNKRLVIFRQHWSLINQLNDDQASRFKNSTIEPDWNRVTDNYLYSTSSQPLQSERLTAASGGGEQSAPNDQASGQRFRLTQFSDLSDAEFVAFLTNDYESLSDNRDSQTFLMQNFQIRPLDEALRNEIALELELRRIGALKISPKTKEDEAAVAAAAAAAQKLALEPMERSLARQVVDELIGDVGLPIGPVSVENISEQEYYSAFTRIANHFKKSYMGGANQRSARLNTAPFNEPNNSELSESDLADERQQRYEIFKENYARFKAWFIKEGWHLSEQQSLAMLRFADMSWHEIKLTLFKICCLTEQNLNLLGRNNATLQYLGSNYQALCQQMQPDLANGFVFATANEPSGSLRLDQQQQHQQHQQQRQASEMSALELYYYYSVHFNKHHFEARDFERKFAIFRRNIESIRRHSCKRDLTLFNSLYLKKADTLSTIDVLDPRRSHTDDLNLDRFEYLNLPKLAAVYSASSFYGGGGGGSAGGSGEPIVPASIAQGDVEIDSTRAGISYRRSPTARFAALLSVPPPSEGQPFSAGSPMPIAYSYADKLLDLSENVNESSARYRQLNVGKIYEFVMQRYRYCMKTIKNVDLYSSDLRQQCQAQGGQFDDKAAAPTVAGGSLAGPLLWSQDDPLGSGTMQNGLARLAQGQDQCGYYRLGLEPWAEGLVKQDALSAQLIQTARCQPGV